MHSVAPILLTDDDDDEAVFSMSLLLWVLVRASVCVYVWVRELAESISLQMHFHAEHQID